MKVAAVQFAPVFADVEQNTQTVIDFIARLAESGVRLVVFPEACLTGYCFDSAEEAAAVAISRGSDALGSIANACVESACHAIVGYAEKEGDLLYNAAAFCGPEGVLGHYRKTHIPFLGLDRFVVPGSDLPIFEVDGARVAIAICYDVRVPELSRCYALSGADIICVITNWPESAEASSDIMCPARAMENHVFVIAADRVGEEKGYRFIGRSKIIDPTGKVMASADHADEAVIVAELDAALARDKTIIKQAGKYELPLFESRQPGLYGRIMDK
ncbi:MAG: carbon-nitrogen hydrolase family protein [Armatimonadota bacterium]|nr:carbon-nitrogen hydrolase family protein [Armatimonadota bacterium]